MTFDLVRLRFHFRAAASLHFPQGKAGNTLRGALGLILPGEYFAPKSNEPGPSGLADAPRPFVFRAAHLDGRTIPPDESFHFDVHLFDTAHATQFTAAFERWRDRAELISLDQEEVAVRFDGPAERAERLRVTFVTPTELKPADRPEFGVLFARLRDRISTLRALYGPGPLDIDFRAMGERAARVRLTRCDLNWHEVVRHSTRTGQVHPLSGFTGETEYDGDLGEFLPYLRAGQWTGVGRQTVWGKGEICFQLCS